MRVYIRAHRVDDGFIGRIIGRFTWGRYKHISMAFVEENGNIRGFQSNSKSGVHFFDLDTVAGDGVDIFRVECNDEQAYQILNSAKSVDGSGYDHAGLWSFFVRKKRENPDKWFCSEVAAWVCYSGGVPLQRLPAWKQSPMIVAASVAIDPVAS